MGMDDVDFGDNSDLTFFEDEREDDWANDPCGHCGPWCDDWGGDGICMVEINQLARIEEEYFKRYVRDNTKCVICGNTLTQYHIPTADLWQWPGNWEFGDYPMIGLMIYGAHDVPKGVLCKFRRGQYMYYHIWVGEKTEQKLVKLNYK